MRKFFRGASFYILIFIIILMIVQFYTKQPEQVKELSFSELTINLENNNVKEMHLINNRVEGVLRGEKKEKFKSYIPMVMNTDTFNENYIFPAIKKGLNVTGEPPAGTPWFIDILPSVFMVLIFVVFWFVFMQQSQGGGSRVMSFGKSRAKLHKEDNKKKVTFKEVAGLEEEKEELKEIVDFLKNPRKYIELGARIPKGVLMVGPPGTGKTYLSRAVAGEAGVPFFSISGSDFVEMFVGVGASRVRDLFEQAKKNSPCIVFIDEIDAVGRKRGAGLGGGHDEREQTLNQLLVEMDGFGINEGIIIIAATNRPDILDPALLRPGRFDRQVVVGIPDIKGREAILEVHSKNKPLADDVNLKVLARRTPGFTPADLENLLNEAALLSARKNNKKIHMDTLEEAITKVIAGPEKRSRVISEKDRKLTAYHEAGHAVVARLLPNTDPVHQVTIIPRGRAGGFTMILPKEDKYYMTKIEMEESIVHLLGGRVAEQLVLHDISTGAQNDLQRATEIARGMVTKYGMSKNLGPMTYGSGEEVFLGRDFTSKKDYSEEVAAQIDKETRDIIDRGYERAEKLLSENIDKLHEIAKALLTVETLNADEFELVFSEGLAALPETKKTKTEENDDKDENQGDF
ncbi:ATP-dependent zinc metalloprotease FtsH [Paramaledivibacter caminithermalis]|uniref:ATP-dependent zinc metalloprotease FtsH n=1 Tax=Paramaledivibacter caminithermalis (strain DSM 15212 / CIP 107654 / DViRD3) TaxID=1121301 RepID=A0A1M6N0M3_PARC5|nr:ATP-dependent zinc metalloprotease FtsH [Paramaledivibacter caminithermalis]SHJ89152.1 cell division protease FtsH [Paramaledivibacter caminithermalis DSM 15212]